MKDTFVVRCRHCGKKTKVIEAFEPWHCPECDARNPPPVKRGV